MPIRARSRVATRDCEAAADRIRPNKSCLWLCQRHIVNTACLMLIQPCASDVGNGRNTIGMSAMVRRSEP